MDRIYELQLPFDGFQLLTGFGYDLRTLSHQRLLQIDERIPLT